VPGFKGVVTRGINNVRYDEDTTFTIKEKICLRLAKAQLSGVPDNYAFLSFKIYFANDCNSAAVSTGAVIIAS